ncbi:dipeptidase [Paenibacillus sediminis]|uniref:Membrane dipeptidase n=1 Tax=Paenibacillus sediminis TaxID=664909 RepID=A0ABS4H1E0_9BACL|nr:membrane dipeptidase [Paenibacillus sediminis]
MKRGIVDFHCDALSKMQMNPKINFASDERLDVSRLMLEEGGVMLQCFAIFLSPHFEPHFELILDQMGLFKQKVSRANQIPLIQWREDIENLRASTHIGGLLSIEGADGLEGNMFYLQLCYEQGVRFLGLTWNYANWAADGVMEPRNGGFTKKGKVLVAKCNELGIILDVSHLSEQGFAELTELSQRPFIASHSNSYTICNHVRNLKDDQIKAIIRMNGRIGLTFVPWFVRDTERVVMEDLLPHIEHICELGGAKHLMLGSDFDGIDKWIVGLENAGKYQRFVDLLLRYYPEDLVLGILSGNALHFLNENLPARRNE